MPQKPKLNNRVLLVFVVFLFVGTCLFVVGFFSNARNMSYQRKFVKTEATITDISNYRRSVNESDAHDVYVAFTVKGKRYEGRISGWDSGMYIGKKITVFYNPQNPWEFHHDSSLMWVIFMLLGFSFMLGGAIPIIVMMRKHTGKKALLKKGKKVMAEITDIIDSSYTFNSSYGKHIVCERLDPLTGMYYRYKSDVIWFNPESMIKQLNITQLPVFLDQKNEKNYYVDMSKLFERVKDFT